VSRVWQYNDDPQVICARPEDGSHSHSADSWTEVQVVPLDAIVIERAQMLAVEDVTTADDGAIVDGDYNILATVEHHTRRALINLALAEYLREHPPVDEAQVAALAAMLPNDGGDLARRIIATGRVQVTP
jgi:hypothetical protein